MIRHLGRKHTITVASLAHSGQELSEGAGLKEYCQDVIAEVVPSASRWRKAVEALPTAKPSSAAYFWSKQLRKRVVENVRRMKPDVVWVHCAFMAAYAKGIACDLRVLDYGDLDSAKWSEYASSRPFPLSLGYALEGWKLRRYEGEAANQFDYCTFTAPGELSEFRRWKLETPALLIPNGVDLDYFHVRAPHSQTDSTIVFVGRMDYFPNVQGAVHFAQNVFPIVRKRFPTAKLRIVGSNPIAVVRSLSSSPGVTVTGSVPDIRPHLADAAVAVAPLRIARGTQNKILECMAMGIPVVSSPEASRGVQAAPGEHLLVGHTDEEFAAHVLRLLRDSELGNRMALAAREQLKRCHSWSRSMELVDTMLDRCPTITAGRYSEDSLTMGR
jgi:sugar transferase (PEP-CTERM/EpsH1 system associated)